MGNTMKLNPNQSWGNFLKAAKYYSSTPAKEEYIARSKLGLSDFEIIMCNGDYKEALKMLLEKIEKAPAADVVEVRHGRWHDVYMSSASSFVGTCSVCGKSNDIPPVPLAKYCPNCGAKMDGGQDDVG